MKRRIYYIAFLIILVISCLNLVACGGVDNMKLSFVVDGEIVSTIETNGNETISLPNDPTKTGYTFDGWYWDDGIWKQPFTANSLLNAPIKNNMSVYAKWNEDTLLPKNEDTILPKNEDNVLPKIEYTKNRKVFHKDNHQTFLFSFTDAEGNYLAAAGLVEIKIVNSLDQIVYEKKINFYESYFTTWTTTIFGNKESYLACGIEIADSDIKKGMSVEGKLYATVTATDASFKEAIFDITNLPVEAGISIVNGSGTFYDNSGYNGGTYSYTNLISSSVNYEITSTNKISVSLKVTCQCLYQSSGWSWDTVGYKVYNSEGIIVNTDCVLKKVTVGEKWTGTDTFYLDDIGNYTIRFYNISD